MGLSYIMNLKGANPLTGGLHPRHGETWLGVLIGHGWVSSSDMAGCPHLTALFAVGFYSLCSQ